MVDGSQNDTLLVASDEGGPDNMSFKVIHGAFVS
jgi:hypothetical protein